MVLAEFKYTCIGMKAHMMAYDSQLAIKYGKYYYFAQYYHLFHGTFKEDSPAHVLRIRMISFYMSCIYKQYLPEHAYYGSSS